MTKYDQLSTTTTGQNKNTHTDTFIQVLQYPAHVFFTITTLTTRPFEKLRTCHMQSFAGQLVAPTLASLAARKLPTSYIAPKLGNGELADMHFLQESQHKFQCSGFQCSGRMSRTICVRYRPIKDCPTNTKHCLRLATRKQHQSNQPKASQNLLPLVAKNCPKKKISVEVSHLIPQAVCKSAATSSAEDQGGKCLRWKGTGLKILSRTLHSAGRCEIKRLSQHS